jgi:hypothetical protein
MIKYLGGGQINIENGFTQQLPVKRWFGICEKALYMHVDYTDNLIDWCGDTDLLSLSRYKLMT